MHLSNFLRTVLKFDAAACLGMAAMILPTAAALEGPMGIDSAALTASAAALIPIGLFILWLGFRREAPAVLVWLVILGNAGWTAGSLAVASSLPGISPLGQAMVAAQGLAVLALAGAEWLGLRWSLQARHEEA